jgi:hypothetical protein
VNVAEIQAAIAPLRQALLHHPLYREINRPAALRIFMEHHIFAVWDFMSLLKTLQQRLSCVATPWLPPANPMAARLVNEIVLGEESDADGQGGYGSHFELYHRAMTRFGASATQIDRLLDLIRQGLSAPEALAALDVGRPVRQFVGHTFEVIATRDLCRIAAAFTFGREDLLPDVFQKIVEQLDQETGGTLAEFKYYLRRHIELDGGEHGPLATRLISDLCGDDPAKWNAAREAAVASLRARIAFWDGIAAAVSHAQQA